MEQWYDIIDFPDYRISSNCVVENKKTRAFVKALKKNGKSFYFQIFDKYGNRYSPSEARLLYCAVKGISPHQVEKSYRFFFKDEKKIENIKIIEPHEFSATVWDIRREYQLPKEQFYEETIKFASAVLNKDFNKISNMIDMHKEEVIRLIERYVTNKVRVELIYNKVKSDIMIGLSNNVLYIGHPLPYIRVYLNRLCKNRNQKYINV